MSINQITLNTNDHSIEYCAGAGAVHGLGSLLKESLGHARRAAVITDANNSGRAGHDVVEQLLSAGFMVEDFSIPYGRAYKTVEYATSVMDRMAQAEIRNRDCVVAVGGNNVLDLAQVVAHIFQGGMEFAAVPTTLEAMITAPNRKGFIDLPHARDGIGAQHEPYVVLADLDYLEDLGANELANGYAVLAQTAFASGGSALDQIQVDSQQLLLRDQAALLQALTQAVSSRHDIYAREGEDDVDQRLSSLDAGGTFAHALEHALGVGALTTGQLLAEGLRFEMLLAVEKLGFEKSIYTAMDSLLTSLRLAPIGIATDADELLASLFETRPRRTRKIYFALPQSVGAFTIFSAEREDLMAHLDAFARSRELLLPLAERPSEIARKAASIAAHDEDEEA